MERLKDLGDFGLRGRKRRRLVRRAPGRRRRSGLHREIASFHREVRYIDLSTRLCPRAGGTKKAECKNSECFSRKKTRTLTGHAGQPDTQGSDAWQFGVQVRVQLLLGRAAEHTVTKMDTGLPNQVQAQRQPTGRGRRLWIQTKQVATIKIVRGLTTFFLLADGRSNNVSNIDATKHHHISHVERCAMSHVPFGWCLRNPPLTAVELYLYLKRSSI